MNWTAAVIFADWLGRLAVSCGRPRQWTLTCVLAGVMITAMFLASLLAHEAARSLVPRHHGLRVKSVTLWLLGGVSGPAAKRPAGGRSMDRRCGAAHQPLLVRFPGRGHAARRIPPRALATSPG
jgi:hypothetical protein